MHQAPEMQFHQARRCVLAQPSRKLATTLVLAAMLLSGATLAGESSSSRYRLVGAGAASTAAQTASPANKLQIVGASGQPVGIAVSTNASVLSGGTSTTLPTDRIFSNGLED